MTLDAPAYPPIRSPLRICSANPRYFADHDGRALFLTGSHTWNNIIDMGPRGAIVPFDFPAYLDLLQKNGHNFIRLWAWDMLGTWNPKDDVLHFPWKRTGPGNALDGRPRFDLAQFDADYFSRLRRCAELAQQRGIYLNVMLFDGWGNFQRSSPPLNAHLFAAENNINGIDILQTLNGKILRGWCTLEHPDMLAIQEAYVRRVVEQLNDLNNIVYEIANEPGAESHAWQEHLTVFIRAVEDSLPKRHPVGQTGGMRCSSIATHRSSADYLATEVWPVERRQDGYRTGHYTYGLAPDERGDRPIFLDTDHLWGIGGNSPWAWKSFCRGYNVIYMDRWDDQPAGFFEHPSYADNASPALRRELGVIRAFSQHIDLTASVPANAAASSGFCLAVPGRQYIALAENGLLSLELPAGNWTATWHNIATGQTLPPQSHNTSAAGTWEFAAPWQDPAALLFQAAP